MIKEHKPEIVRKIWGGKKLEALKGLRSAAGLEPVGETLEIFHESLPYLAKFIDTSDVLSIQVHPHDEYARIHENSSGKTECWLILDSLPGAGIYLGLKPNVTREALKKAIDLKESIDNYLNFYPVSRGDFFYVPAGSIHAIGKDITLAEVQQNSGITYRVWDWNRVDHLGHPRDLHVEKSLDVINFDSTANQLDFFQHKKQLLNTSGLHEVCKHRDFHLFLLNQEMNNQFLKDIKLTRACSVLNLEGDIKINDQFIKAYHAVTIDDCERLSITALEAGSLLLIF